MTNILCLQVTKPPEVRPTGEAEQLPRIPCTSGAIPAWGGYDTPLTPLTMSQHAAPHNLITQRLTPPSNARIRRQKAFLLSQSVFNGDFVKHPIDNTFKLPPMSGKLRARSAEPVPCRELHLSLGNFKSLDTIDLDHVIRTHRSHIPQESPREPPLRPLTKLMSSQFMCITAPPDVKTGEDAVHFFFNHEQNQGRTGMFIYCNFANKDPSQYRPYDLVAVEQQASDPEHFMISATGVCHFLPGTKSSSVTPLHVWIREARQFTALKPLTFFSKFAMVSAWVQWKRSHRHGKFQRRADFLQQHHPLLNEWFSKTTQPASNLVRSAYFWRCCGVQPLRLTCVITIFIAFFIGCFARAEL
jgi:hypothetical protein